VNNSIYLFDFLKYATKKHNIASLIWIALNITLISCTYGLVGASGNIPKAFLIGTILYLISVTIVLSPFGEWVCRLQTGCKKPSENVSGRLQPILDEVVAEARKKNPELPEKIKLYFKDDDEPNAFALGRHTVCCTKGLLNYSNKEIQAIMGHEIGHIANHDTDLILVVTGGNILINILFGFFRIMFKLFVLMGRLMSLLIPGVGGLIFDLVMSFYTFVTGTLLGGFMNLWIRLGIWLTMHSSRKEEFAADTYSCELGYAAGLATFFNRLLKKEFKQTGGIKVKKGLFEALEESHPDTDLRLENIQAYMVTPVLIPEESNA